MKNANVSPGSLRMGTVSAKKQIIMWMLMENVFHAHSKPEEKEAAKKNVHQDILINKEMTAFHATTLAHHAAWERLKLIVMNARPHLSL